MASRFENFNWIVTQIHARWNITFHKDAKPVIYSPNRRQSLFVQIKVEIICNLT